jgi:protein TonB
MSPVLSLSTAPGPEPADTQSPGITPTYTPEPEYPRMARRLGLEGKVLLHVLMALNGIPEEVTVISSSGHPLLDKAAMRAISSWRFSVNLPAENIHEPPSIDIPIRFKLN